MTSHPLVTYILISTLGLEGACVTLQKHDVKPSDEPSKMSGSIDAKEARASKQNSPHTPVRVTGKKEVNSPPFFPSTERTKKRLNRALHAFREGEKRRGVLILEELVRMGSQTTEEHQARILLAQSSIEHSAHTRAISLLRGTSGEPGFEGLRVMAISFEGVEDYEEAAKVWLKAVQEASSASGSEEARKGAARSLFLLGKTEEAAKAIGKENQATLGALVDGALTPTIVERLYGQIENDDPWYAWLALRHARNRWAEGDAVGAKEALNQALKDSVNPHVRHEAKAFQAKFSRWERVSAKRIGILMPLSGKYSKTTAGFKAAIELALESNPTLVPVFKDTAANPVQAAKAAEELIFDEHVSIIVGPVGHIETEAVTAVTRRYHIPHIHFSSKHELGADSKHIFRFRLSPREYGTLMAQYAVQQLGLKRLAVFTPANSHGYAAIAGFWETAVSLGAEIRAVEFFNPKLKTAGEFNPLIGKLLHAKKPGSVQVDFDALFVPCSAAQMRTMVPLLKYWGVRLHTNPSVKGTSKRPLVQLLGSSGWHRSWLIDKGEDLLDNSVFTTPFYYESDDPQSDDFVVRFQGAMNKTPLPVHAEVFDATRLAVIALTGLAGDNHEVRAKLLERLLSYGTVSGVTGSHRLSPEGMVERKPWLMTLDGDTMRPRLPLMDEIEHRKNRHPQLEKP